MKTNFVLDWLADDDLRQRVGRQLNKGEQLHVLRRAIFYANEGHMRQRTLEQQGEQALCLLAKARNGRGGEHNAGTTLIGYARCSTTGQPSNAHRQALRGLAVEEDRIYLDHGLSGRNRDRPGLAQALAAVPGG